MATARTSLTVQSPAGLPEDGVALTYTAADVANGNRFNNINGNKILLARNSGGVDYTATISYVRRGVVVSRTAVTIAAGVTRAFGPFPAEYGDHIEADAAPGEVYVSGNNASMTFAVVELPGLARVSV